MGLFSLQMDEVLAHKGLPPEEPTSPQYEEALALRRALEDATPASRANYEEQCREFIHMIEVIRRSRELAQLKGEEITS